MEAVSVVVEAFAKTGLKLQIKLYELAEPLIKLLGHSVDNN